MRWYATFGFSLSVVIARFSDRLRVSSVWAKIGHYCTFLPNSLSRIIARRFGSRIIVVHCVCRVFDSIFNLNYLKCFKRSYVTAEALKHWLKRRAYCASRWWAAELKFASVEPLPVVWPSLSCFRRQSKVWLHYQWPSSWGPLGPSLGRSNGQAQNTGCFRVDESRCVPRPARFRKDRYSDALSISWVKTLGFVFHEKWNFRGFRENM